MVFYRLQSFKILSEPLYNPCLLLRYEVYYLQQRIHGSWRWKSINYEKFARTKLGGGRKASNEAVADRVLERTWTAYTSIYTI